MVAAIAAAAAVVHAAHAVIDVKEASTLSLALHLFAKSQDAFAEFVSDGWNLLDFIIVISSLLTVMASNVPSVKVFRLIRVFRVARIFRRLKSLNRIISALACAVVPVANSFLILALVTCIWAALGTQFFRYRSEPYFGSFSKSVFTMFQVVTGDGWASSVARELFDDQTLRTSTDFGIAFFLFSYVLIAGVVLINVVVAVLLDEFISSIQREKQEIEMQAKIEEDKRKALTRSNGILDPLSSHLARFVTERDLTKSISETFDRLDNDASGGLNFEEFQRGLKRLPTKTPIHIQEDDFDLLTEGGKLCNSQGEFSSEQFQEMMREEIRRYAQRQLANAVQESTSNDMRAMSLMIKLMDQRIDAMSKIVHSWGYSNKGMARIMEVYYQHDQDDSGQLSREEAAHALTQLSIPKSKLDEVISRLDSDCNGVINKEEFYSVLDIIDELSDDRLRNIERIVASIQQAVLPQDATAEASRQFHTNPSREHDQLTRPSSEEARDSKSRQRPASSKRKHSKADFSPFQGLVDLVFTDSIDREGGKRKGQGPAQVKDKFVNAVMRHKQSGSTLTVYSHLDNS